MHCSAHKVLAPDACVVGEFTVLDALCLLVMFRFGCGVILPYTVVQQWHLGSLALLTLGF